MCRKILLLALESNWHGAARLPRALQDAGFAVGVACRTNAHLAQTRFRDQLFLLSNKDHGRGLLAGLQTIVRAWPPDLILPLDDRAALLLARFHEYLSSHGRSDEVVALLKRSLGNPTAIFEAASKRRTAEAARQLGLRVPAGRPVDTIVDIQAFAGQHGWPVVIKRSFGSGGNAVFVCANEAEVVAALARLRPEQKLKARLSLWREQVRGRQFNPDWLPVDDSLTANQFIAGECVTALTAAVDGRMLAALTAVRMRSYPNEKGPSSVLRFERIESLRQTAAALLQHWGLTGLIGFDFIRDTAGQTWLLECNPRPTPIAHLGRHAGEDLCAALYAGLAGTTLPAVVPRDGFVVAHFPTEQWRDPQSPHLTSAFHDVPQDDPDLLAALQRDKPH